jgi:hypothetical protein
MLMSIENAGTKKLRFSVSESRMATEESFQHPGKGLTPGSSQDKNELTYTINIMREEICEN